MRYLWHVCMDFDSADPGWVVLFANIWQFISHSLPDILDSTKPSEEEEGEEKINAKPQKLFRPNCKDPWVIIPCANRLLSGVFWETQWVVAVITGSHCPLCHSVPMCLPMYLCYLQVKWEECFLVCCKAWSAGPQWQTFLQVYFYYHQRLFTQVCMRLIVSTIQISWII